jgi:hypothetical protein
LEVLVSHPWQRHEALVTSAQMPLEALPEYGPVTEFALTPIHELKCHPATPAGVRLSLTVQVHMHEASWELHYRLLGDIASLRIPPSTSSGPADGLWKHTCFEAFVAAEGDEAYRELNFSPSGQWAVYRFHAQRARDMTDDGVRPVVEISGGADSLQLRARWPLTDQPAGAFFRLGLCAVIEEADGRLSYWALAHPTDSPDFHHRDGWALRLASS